MSNKNLAMRELKGSLKVNYSVYYFNLIIKAEILSISWNLRLSHLPAWGRIIRKWDVVEMKKMHCFCGNTVCDTLRGISQSWLRLLKSHPTAVLCPNISKGGVSTEGPLPKTENVLVQSNVSGPGVPKWCKGLPLLLLPLRPNHCQWNVDNQKTMCVNIHLKNPSHSYIDIMVQLIITTYM